MCSFLGIVKTQSYYTISYSSTQVVNDMVMLISTVVVSYRHMIEDTQTPPIDKKDKSELTMDEHWNDVEMMSRSSDAARRLAEQTTADQSAAAEAHDTGIKNRSFRRGVAAGVIATTAVVGAGAGVYAASSNQGPHFSEKTAEYVVQDGDGLYDAAEQIKGIDSVDIRDAVDHIQVDPANIDVLKDGLQPGEVLEIPDSVQK